MLLPYEETRIEEIETNQGSVVISLASKQDVLVSGVNVKTVNLQSILGAGNLSVIAVGGSFVSITSMQVKVGGTFQTATSKVKVGGVFI